VARWALWAPATPAIRYRASVGATSQGPRGPSGASAADGDPEVFEGDARFTLEKRLGEGGMGVVFEALDRERGEHVALKMLTRLDASSISRLKHEFRVLADLGHPGLVTYHELVSSHGHWFFTMELVDGVDFMRWVTQPGDEPTPLSGRRTSKSGASFEGRRPLSSTPDSFGASGAASASPSAGSLGSSEPDSLGVGSGDPTNASGSVAGDSGDSRVSSESLEASDPARAVDAREGAVDGRTRPTIVPSPEARSAAFLGALRASMRGDAATMLAPLGETVLPITKALSLGLAHGPASAAGLPKGADLPFDPERTLSWWGEGPRIKLPTISASQRRLRHALRQLAEGLVVLHSAGILHLDVKPSNVLVTPRGRVVLLDFGLASRAAEEADSTLVQGTPAYMAPEQVFGKTSAASDWYAVGVMLYEALVGTVPFVGPPRGILAAKQVLSPPRPSELVEGVPPDLDALCAELLSQDPSKRPTGEEVLARLGALPEPSRRSSSKKAPFVGRESAMRELREAFDTTRTIEDAPGHATVVSVRGTSGMGKSALVSRFLDEVSKRDGALVLSGRCFERESVPYKAVDALVDALVRHLRTRSPAELAELLPDDVRALARLFPALLEIEAVAARAEVGRRADELEQRRVGFAVLRELFTRLRRERPLVLHIDDLQWGDADSAALLSDLLRPPSPPCFLLVLSFRSEEESSSATLETLRQRAGWTLVPQREVFVGPLSEEQSTALARAILGSAADPGVAHAIALEAEGSPFFVAELARWAHAQRAVSAGGALVKLGEVVVERVRHLDDEARELLEVLAIAGRPIEPLVAFEAAGLGDEAVAALARLRGEQLARTRGSKRHELAECYHDRIREAVAGAVDEPTKRRRHAALAEALLATGRGDPEALAMHFRGAGDRPRALVYVREAALRAVRALAFDRAAELFASALELTPADDPARLELMRRRADALANASRAADASHAYRDAAARASGEERLELMRRAAEQACRSGHIDEGIELFEALLGGIGLRLARTPLEALASLLATRARVRLRGLRFVERAEASVPRELLRKLDVCWGAAAGLGMVDPIRGNDLQARALLFALEAGEPARMARSLALEACYSSTAGHESSKRTRDLIDQAERLAERSDDPHALAMVQSARAFELVFVGKWRDGARWAERAEQLLRQKTTGTAHEIATCQIFGVWALFNMGDYPEMQERYPEQLRYAEERGDRFSIASKTTLVGHVYHLLADDPGEAITRVDACMRGWSQKGFHVQHWYELLARTHVDLYRGDGVGAYERVARVFPTAKGSLLFRVVSIRNDMLWLRARAALAAASQRFYRDELLRLAEGDARRVMKGGLENTPGWGHSLLACVAHLRGQRARALDEARAAQRAFARAEMEGHRLAMRRREGEITGGPAGDAIIAEADVALRARGVRRPERFIDLLAPWTGPRHKSP
jgi:serine/threonine protein kinase/tetratricopeptide (TPR) repeat protein